MIKFLRTTRKVVLAGILAVVTIGGYFSVLSMINRTNDETSKIINDLAFETERQNKFINADELIANTKEDREKIKSYFLTKEGIVTFIEQIERTASDTGLSIEISSVNVVTNEENPIESLALVIETEGSWNNIFYFISYLENLPLHVTFNGINVENASSRNEESGKVGGGEWTAELNVSIAKLK